MKSAAVTELSAVDLRREEHSRRPRALL